MYPIWQLIKPKIIKYIKNDISLITLEYLFTFKPVWYLNDKRYVTEA